MIVAAHGSWPSPIAVADLTAAGVVGLAEPLLDGDDLYWLESRADEGGRVALCRRRDGVVTELAPGHNVRTRVHEYGGGAYAVAAGVVVFSELSTGQVWVLDGGAARPLTPEGPWRFGDLRVHPGRGLVLAVREDHGAGGEPVNTVVALRLDGENVAGGRVLCAGADFYSSPEFADDGRLAWVEWDHPAMPWDATRLRVARLTSAAEGPEVGEALAVAGGAAESVVAPGWLPDGRLLFITDATGFWNLAVWDGSAVSAVTAVPHDLAFPQWVLGMRPYAILGSGRVVCAPIVDGRATPHRLDLASGKLSDLGFGCTDAGGFTASGGRVACVAGRPDSPRAVLAWTADDRPEVVRAGSRTELPADLISRAEAVTWEGPEGPVHGWFYPPTNPEVRGPDGEAPPLLVLSHGGPTALATADFALGYQFWTSRGFAILDVNYGGSSGYGRAYRQRLAGRWGIVDVRDCVHGALALAARGRVDRRRLAIKGGSAGGYTTLRALTTSTVFAAGVSRYGIGDLTALATDTHKFESRYLDGLVGPWPAAQAVYAERSPLNHVDALNCPMLILQGADDRVVPPNHAEAMAAAVSAKGLPVELIVFDGEGHGFRRAETIEAATGAELAFYGRVFGFTPAPDPGR